MTANDTSIDARDWSLLGLLSILWGGSFFFNGVVLKELPPLTVVFLRVALAAIMLLPLLWLYRIRFPDGLSGWRPFIAIGLLNNVLPFSLIVVGQTYIPCGLASILNATTPLFTVVVMAVAGEEKLSCAADRGRRRGPDRRDHSPRRRVWVGERAGARHPALSCGRLQLRIVGAAGATAAVELAAARHRDVSDAGLGRDDDRCRGLVERPWQLPMPGATTGSP